MCGDGYPNHLINRGLLWKYEIQLYIVNINIFLCRGAQTEDEVENSGRK